MQFTITIPPETLPGITALMHQANIAGANYANEGEFVQAYAAKLANEAADRLQVGKYFKPVIPLFLEDGTPNPEHPNNQPTVAVEE